MMPCSLRGTVVEALHNPTVGTNIMSEFLVENLLGNMPLVLTNKVFKISIALIFEYSGIVRAISIEIDGTKVHLDFHIYAILDFDLLIDYPFEKLFQEKPSQGSLNKKLGKTAFATPISYLESPIAKQHLTHNPFEEVKFVSPFISPKLSCETKCPLSPSIELKPCPCGHQNVGLNNVRVNIDPTRYIS